MKNSSHDRPKLQIIRPPHQYNHRTQQNSPVDCETTRPKFSNPKQFTMPLVNQSLLNTFGFKPRGIRSLHNSKSRDKNHNVYQFDREYEIRKVANLDKEALFDYANEKKKKRGPNSNRLFADRKPPTEGNEKEVFSGRDRKVDTHRVTFKLNTKHKRPHKTESMPKSPQEENYRMMGFPKTEQLVAKNQHPIKNQLFAKNQSHQIEAKKNLSKHESKLTALEQEEAKTYEVFYMGPRRIYSRSDFTDQEGDPKILVQDSIAYRYEIVGMLGRGSFGKVYKAFDHKKKELVALKIIKSQKKFIEQAKVEVEILQCALFRDPKFRSNVVRMKGSFVFRGHSCITFQILHKNLYEFLKEHNFSGFSHDLIRRFSIQILQALNFFRKNKIIHCDLKPENILLKEESKSGIKVIDVGSGCFQDKQIYTYIQSRFYRAPEIILGVRYTPAIDMWSFGCILVELCAGFPLFPGESESEQMLMLMQILGMPPASILLRAERRKIFFDEDLVCKIPQQHGKERQINSIDLKEIVGSHDKSFIDLVLRCLEWDPDKRITPREALLHDWILKGLPEEIRSQHIEQLKQQIQI